MRLNVNVNITIPEEGIVIHLKSGYHTVLHNTDDITVEGEYVVNNRTTERFGPVLCVTFPFGQVAAAWRNKGEVDAQEG